MYDHWINICPRLATENYPQEKGEYVTTPVVLRLLTGRDVHHEISLATVCYCVAFSGW